MEHSRRQLRRAQLDIQLLPLAKVLPGSAPSDGWIKSIREALGISLQTFAKRLDLASSSTVHQLEQAEVAETITLKRLRTAADGLGCDLVIAFVPRIPLAEMVERRAHEKAYQRVHRVAHSMVMERQGVSNSQLDNAVKRATEEILVKGDPRLWD